MLVLSPAVVYGSRVLRHLLGLLRLPEAAYLFGLDAIRRLLHHPRVREHKLGILLLPCHERVRDGVDWRDDIRRLESSRPV